MENFTLKNNYKNNNKYKESYNNLIEHFTDTSSCSSTCTVTTLSDIDAAYFLLYKSDPSSDSYDNYLSETTTDTGISISSLAHYVGMSDDVYNCGVCKINTATNVSDSVKDYFNNSVTSTRLTQKNVPSTNYVIYNNATIDAINTLMETQDSTWKDINSGDSDYLDKLNSFRIEQASLKEGQDLKIPYNKQLQQYKKDTSSYYDNLRLDSRNKYINQVQSSIIEKEKQKDRMATSDIMTKEREIQLNRVSFLKKKRVNQYYRISVFTLGLCIIVVAVAQMIPDSNKIIVGIVVGVIIILALVLIIGKLIRDSKRYNLDYDEVNFSPYKKDKKKKEKKSCSSN